jgi:hypothetical protein
MKKIRIFLEKINIPDFKSYANVLKPNDWKILFKKTRLSNQVV